MRTSKIVSEIEFASVFGQVCSHAVVREPDLYRATACGGATARACGQQHACAWDAVLSITLLRAYLLQRAQLGIDPDARVQRGTMHAPRTPCRLERLPRNI